MPTLEYMPARRILPDSGTIRQLHLRYTYAQIAEMYGVTETAVYLRVRNDSPKDITPANRYSDHLPWRVKVEHMWAPPAKYLRLLARYERGEDLGEKRMGQLQRWLDKMREMDVVVDYDPDCPPNPASPTYGGFHYVRREPSDGFGFVRKPDLPSSEACTAG